jgi:sialate O-acetylesterase
MVLQRDKPLPVWGTADAGADVTVTLGDRHATTKTDNTGHWSVKLEALSAGGPLVLTATANGS